MELAHISDLHVTAPLGPWWGLLSKRIIGAFTLLLLRKHSNDILQAAVDDLRHDPPDHLAVTGDLSNLALESELSRAAAYLAAAQVPPERLTVIPGNHDGYVRGPWLARRFEHHLAPLMGLEPPALAWPRVQRHGEVLLVSLSSCVPTPWFTAYGRVAAPQLAALREVLARERAAFKVVLVHHPPLQADGKPDWPWRRNLSGRAVLEAARAGGADLVLCGHTHKAFTLRVTEGGPKPILIACAGSTTKQPKRLGHAATYNRYRIEDGKLVEMEVRGFCPERRAFVRVRCEPV